jgi:hypothetical protein
MRKLPLLTLLLVTCVRSPVAHPPPEYDESIRFPKGLNAVWLGKSNERLRLDGAIVQAVMVVAKDFIPSSGGSGCFRKPGDFLYEVLRQGDIIFVAISPDYSSCESGPWPMDWGAIYAISPTGRILRRAHPEELELEWTSSRSSPDAGTNRDAGYSREYELSDLVPMLSAPVDEPPFFTRPEWLESENNPWRSLRNKHRIPSLPDGGTPDGGVHNEFGP